MVESVAPKAIILTAPVAERLRSDGYSLPELAPLVVTLGMGKDSDLGGFGSKEIVEWKDLAPFRPAPAAPVPEDSPMLITHTSGTTDTPKLVMHTAETLWAGTRVELLPVPGGVSRSDDTFLSSIAFGHSRAFTWVTAQFHWGPRKMVAVGDHHRDSAQRMLEESRPTIVESLPNVLQHWKPLAVDRPELFARVRLYINTFDIMHASIARPFIEASTRRSVMWAHSWGQSEVGPMAAGIFTRASFRSAARREEQLQMGRLGPPWPGLIKLRVVDPESGAPVPRGTEGYIQVRSRSVAVGYLGEMDRYHDKWSEGWWNTGDFGFRDRWGRVRFLDRGMDRLHEGSAVELESILLDRLDDCDEVIVLPRGDHAYLPVLSMRPGAVWDQRRWHTVVSDLPAFADPVLVPLDELPRTSTWKVRRHQLQGGLGLIDTTDERLPDRRFN